MITFSSVSWLPFFFFLPQLPELYAFVQNFSKENTKLNRLNAHSISPSEAQKIFSQNLNALGEADVREDDSQPLLTCKVVRKDERPESMTELLHRSLLSSPLYPLERLSRSQRRISQHGIPPPSYTFPYEILISSSTGSPAADAKKEVQGIRILCRLGIPAVSPEKFIFEDRISKYILVDPGNWNRWGREGEKEWNLTAEFPWVPRVLNPREARSSEVQGWFACWPQSQWEVRRENRTFEGQSSGSSLERVDYFDLALKHF